MNTNDISLFGNRTIIFNLVIVYKHISQVSVTDILTFEAIMDRLFGSIETHIIWPHSHGIFC